MSISVGVRIATEKKKEDRHNVVNLKEGVKGLPRRERNGGQGQTLPRFAVAVLTN